MKLILAIVALASLVQNILAADLEGIQNATPIGISLNNPSIEFGGVNNGDATQEEPNLSGYRPLYPPYFQRNAYEQQQQAYYDKEYYNRGAQTGNFDARLDRTLKTLPASAGAAPSDDVQVYVVSLDSQPRSQSVVQLRNQPQTQLQLLPQPQIQTQFQPQAHTQLQFQQYARGFSNYRTQRTQSFFYTFKFPSS